MLAQPFLHALAVRAGHRDGSFPSARRFDSVDCDHRERRLGRVDRARVSSVRGEHELIADPLQRGASGEAMIAAAEARRSVRLARTNAGFDSLHRDDRFPGCSPAARTRRLGRRGRWCKSSHPDQATVSRTGRSATNAVVKVRFLPVVRRQATTSHRLVDPGSGASTPATRVRFLPVVPPGCSSGVRARARGARGRWCDSSHPDQDC